MSAANSMDLSALVVLVPEAEPLVADFRDQFDISAKAGLGAHVTVLVPFRLPERVTRADLDVLRALFGAASRFTFTLSSIDRFPSALYLCPTPASPFKALTRSVVAAFPDCPPYRGAFPDPVPHLTVAQQPPAEDLNAVEAQVRPKVQEVLPLACAATEVCLVFKRDGRWSVAERFALGDAD
jgi:2'-5' RNA ligase